MRPVKIGFNSGAFGDYPLTVVIPRLADLGYQGVELNAQTAPWTRPHVWPRLSSGRRAEIRRLTRDHGLEISSISAHISLVDADRRTRQRHLDFLKGCIDLAPEVGANVVHAIAGTPPEGVPAERAWGWLLEGLDTCVDYSAERGVTFAFEAVVGSLVANMSALSRLLADLGNHRLHVNLVESQEVV